MPRRPDIAAWCRDSLMMSARRAASNARLAVSADPPHRWCNPRD
jgi:hypothetical protein